MAITIQQYPISDGGGGLPTAVYIPVGYVVSSNNTAQSNFKFIADVYPGGATSPTRLVRGTDPINGYGFFEIQGELKSWLSSNPPLTTGAFVDCTNSYNNFAIKFGEQYGASSAITSYPNLTNTTGTVINAALPQSTYWNGTDPLTYYRIGNTSRKFLTDAPRTVNATTGLKIGTNEQFFLYFLQASGSVAYNAVIKTYSASGSLIQTVKYGTNYGSGSTIQYFSVGSYNLNNLTGLEPRYSASVGQPIIDSSVSYYDVYLESSGGAALTESFRIFVEDECSPGTAYRLCWLNKFGGFDQFTFTWDSEKNVEYQKDTAQKTDYEYYGGGVRYFPYHRQKVTVNTIATDKTILRSGWITEEKSTWLEGLFASPEVYILDNTNQLIAISGLEKTYRYKTRNLDGLFNLEFSFEGNYNRFLQQA